MKSILGKRDAYPLLSLVHREFIINEPVCIKKNDRGDENAYIFMNLCKAYQDKTQQKFPEASSINRLHFISCIFMA